MTKFSQLKQIPDRNLYILNGQHAVLHNTDYFPTAQKMSLGCLWLHATLYPSTDH